MLKKKLILLCTKSSNIDYIEDKTAKKFLTIQKIEIKSGIKFDIKKAFKLTGNPIILIDLESGIDGGIHLLNQVQKIISYIKNKSPTTVVVLLVRKISARKVCDLFRLGLDDCFLSPIDYSKLNNYLRHIASLSDFTPAMTEDHTQLDYNGALLKACQAVESTLEIEALLDQILELTVKGLSADQGSILLHDKKTDTLKMLAARNLPEDIVEAGYIPRKGSIAEWVLEKNEPLILNDIVKDDSRFTSVVKERKIKSSMCVPLRIKGTVIGVLNVMRGEVGRKFTEADLHTLLILATQSAIAIENARLYKENIESTRLATIGGTVSGISHCMKNILTGIRGGVSICETTSESGDKKNFGYGWNMLKKNVERISTLVMDMLDYSKIKEPVRELTQIVRLVNDLLESFKQIIKNLNINIEVNIQPELPEINIDPDQIYRCLLNLVGNAIDAIPEEIDGKILISALSVDANKAKEILHSTPEFKNYMLIEISDNGRGIPADKIDLIFTPFFSTKGSRGTGLGCAVSKKIIEEHKGRIFVKSKELKGTTFTILLPFV